MTENPPPGRTPGQRSRHEELVAGLTAVEQRIATACAAAGRPRDEVTLVVVTKTYPASDVRLLSALGVADVAENRDQDAAPKAAECHDLPLQSGILSVNCRQIRSVPVLGIRRPSAFG